MAPAFPNEFPAEIVFTPNSCNGTSYKYIYMWASPRIMRATSNSTDWNFTDVGSSNLPDIASQPDTGGRIGSFAIGTNSTGGMRLFYGNYNNHKSACPQALIWESDCTSTTAPGDAWTLPIELRVSNPNQNSACPQTIPPTPDYKNYYHGREVHSIEVDPANTSNIYVTVDDELADSQTLGLWRSTNGGDQFYLLTPNSSFVGINFIFPSTSNSIFFETDGGGGFSPNGGPLRSWNKSGGALGVAALWPSPVPGGSSSWSGSGGGIIATSEQNIFLATDGFGPSINSLRSGTWYFSPPFYNTPTLLEDLAPPICLDSLSCEQTLFLGDSMVLLQGAYFLLVATSSNYLDTSALHLNEFD